MSFPYSVENRRQSVFCERGRPRCSSAAKMRKLARIRRDENVRLGAMLNLQVEPVTTFESSALQSSWIQRLKPAANGFSTANAEQVGRKQVELPSTTNNHNPAGNTLDYGQQLWNQIHMLKLSPDVPPPAPKLLQLQLPEVNLNHAAADANEHKTYSSDNKFVFGQHEVNPRTPAKRSSLLRLVKPSNVKFKKPPLPPSSRSGSRASAKETLSRGKNKPGPAVTQWKVRTIDIKVEQTRARPNNKLFSEFASRLEIREMVSTPSPQQQCQCSLTPVISPSGIFVQRTGPSKGSATTASLTQGVLELCKRDSKSFHWGFTGRSSSYCASSPFPTARSDGISLQGSVETDHRCKGSIVLDKKRNADGNATEMKRGHEENINSVATKRRRLSSEASTTKDKQVLNATCDLSSVPLSGIWLQRWNAAAARPRTHDRKLKKLGELLPPSAAAVAIAGSAARHMN